MPVDYDKLDYAIMFFTLGFITHMILIHVLYILGIT